MYREDTGSNNRRLYVFEEDRAVEQVLTSGGLKLNWIGGVI